LCMLDDYNLDYTDAATVVPNLKTIYQVGRGMILPGEDDAEQAQVGGDAPAKLAAPETAAGLPGAAEAVPAAPATPEAAPPETTGPQRRPERQASRLRQTRRRKPRHRR